MFVLGFLILSLLVFIVFASSLYKLVTEKNLSSVEKTQLKTRIGVSLIIVLVIMILRGGFGMGLMSHSSSYIFTVIFSIIVNSSLLTLIFRKLEAIFEFSWLKAFYYIGVFCVIATSLLVSTTQAIYPGILETTVTIAIFVISSSILVAILAVFARLFLSTRGKQFPSHSNGMKFTNKDKIQHYYDEGLTETEIDYFRSQMAHARQQIESVETGFTKTAKLRAIEVRYNTIEVAQNFFKDIVEDPMRFTQASQFLYKFLPSLEDLILKYNEINGHVAKNKQTYLILEKSAQTIEQICEQITDEYVLFHQNTYNEMQDEIKLANRNLSRKAARQEMSSEKDDIDNTTDSVDAILKESNDWLADQDNDQ